MKEMPYSQLEPSFNAEQNVNQEAWRILEIRAPVL
jgi:hypothetical protein